MEMLGAITGLIGAGLQAKAQADQLEYEYTALNWQKQRAAQQDWMAGAARTDQYGNVTKYDPVLNKWSVDLTPDQQNIMQSGQKEQLLQLTQDAPAARKVKQAIQQRAAQAKEPFNAASLGYQYNQPPSEEAIRSQLTGLMATNDMIKSKADQALLMRSAARLGKGAQASDIINATDQALGNAQSQNNRMLQARQDALKEFGARTALHEDQWGKPMTMWGNLMAQGGDIPGIPKSGVTDTTGAQQQAMLQAFNQGTSGVGAAMQQVGTAMGKSPDLSSVAKALAGIKAGKSSSTSGDAATGDGGFSLGTMYDWQGQIDPSRNEWGIGSSSDGSF